MGKTNPARRAHRQQSMILVPMKTPGVKRVRHLERVRLRPRAARPRRSRIRGRARARGESPARRGPRFRDRAGAPGSRAHPPLHAPHRRRRTGAREPVPRAQISASHSARRLSEQGVTLERIAEARILIDQARWLVLNAAYMMDTVGNRAAKAGDRHDQGRRARPWRCRVIDWAIQMHGGGGVSDDFPLAAAYAAARTLRLADGPDEVHRSRSASSSWRAIARARCPAQSECSARVARACPTGTSHSWPGALAAASRSPRPPTLFYNAEASARRYPAKPFLIFYDTELSFAEFLDEAERVAGFLEQRCGVRKGDRVLLLHAEQPAVRDRLLRHSARQRGRRAGESHESHAGIPRCAAGCRSGDGDRRRRSCIRASSRCSVRRARARDRGRVFGLLEAADDVSRCPSSLRRRASSRAARGVTLWTRRARSARCGPAP